jgi:hypothetical protein
MPQVIQDLYESNADAFIAEISNKLAKLKGVRSSAKAGGDFALTISAQIQTVEAALVAAENHRESVMLSYPSQAATP